MNLIEIMKNISDIEKLQKKVLLNFSTLDYKNNFSFTSGNLSALSIDDGTLKNLLFAKNWVWCVTRVFYFFKECANFILYTVIPIKNIGILLRTLLRFTCNVKPQQKSHDVAILSLGNSCRDKDAYFKPLLAALKGNYHYFKIVGGKSFLTEKFTYIESLLAWHDFLKFSLYVFLSPIVDVVYLLRGAVKIHDAKLRVVYLILGLRDINRGVVVQNKLIHKSIQSLLSCREYNFEKVIYPMEGRNWEKNIVKTLNTTSLTSIGYVHCILTPRHLSLLEVGFYREREFPSVILTPSEMTFNLIKKSFKDVMVKRGFFLRGSGAKLNNKMTISQSKILFALTSDRNQSRKIIEHISNSKLLKKYDVIVRPNKNSSTYQALYAYAKSLGLNLYSDLSPSLMAPAICFFRSSSVALDYLKNGSAPVYLRFNDEVSNNVFELDDRIKCQEVTVGKNFEFEIGVILSRKNFVEQFTGGEVISNYYLNQSYNDQELLELL